MKQENNERIHNTPPKIYQKVCIYNESNWCKPYTTRKYLENNHREITKISNWELKKTCTNQEQKGKNCFLSLRKPKNKRAQYLTSMVKKNNKICKANTI